MPGGILAFDPSLADFGYAYAEAGGEIAYDSQRLVRVGASDEEIQNALDIFLDARIEVFRPAWIVREKTYEGPNAKTSGVLRCMGWQIDLRAKDRGIGCREAETKAFTKFFTGQGVFPGKTSSQRSAAKKKAMVARCHLLGLKVRNHNQADACGILYYAEVKLFPEMRLSMRRPAGPLFAPLDNNMTGRSL
jgi:hypothetical protein